MNVTQRGGMYYSQFGEDELLHDFFHKSRGVCVEVGAHDGVTFSNTLFFEKLGWDCVLVEPHPRSCSQIRELRRGRLFECAASNINGEMLFRLTDGSPELSTLGSDISLIRRYSAEEIRTVTVQVRTLDSILEEAGLCNIDFISIDVENHEIQVLEAFSISRWKPRIVIVEDNSYGLNSVVRQYFRKHSYVPFRMTDCNIWYANVADNELVKGPWQIQFMAELGVAWLRRIRRNANKIAAQLQR